MIPPRRVWLVVDEWGTWYDVEPGTNPGFLYQQNTLRDALVAALNLNIFAHHADRVKMAAIAQMVNVLQAMMLTDGAKMVLTPTYWVFDLYKPWQDATALPIELQSPYYRQGRVRDAGGQRLGGARHRGAGACRASPISIRTGAQTVTIRLAGLTATQVGGTIVTAPAMDAVNTFDRPDGVVPAAFTGAHGQRRHADA